MVIYLRDDLNIYIPTIQNPSKTILLLENASHHRKDAIYGIADTSARQAGGRQVNLVLELFFCLSIKYGLFA